MGFIKLKNVSKYYYNNELINELCDLGNCEY